MQKLADMPNGELWERWKAAIDEQALDPEDRAKERVVDRLEDEITRRFRAASSWRQNDICRFPGSIRA